MVEVRGHHLCPELLTSDSVVIDLGAHLGEFARAVAERWNARVFAVEAHPETFAGMYSGGRVSRHHFAISDRVTTARLYVAANAEGNSLDPHHRDVSEAAFLEVPATTLDAFMEAQGIARADLLKVDIEGAEIALFKSLSDETLRRFRQISIEFHDFIPALGIAAEVEAIKARMARLGFACIVCRRPNVDVLFVNREAPGVSAWALARHRAHGRLILGWKRLFAAAYRVRSLSRKRA